MSNIKKGDLVVIHGSAGEERKSFFIRGREFTLAELVRRTSDEDCWHVEVPQI